MKNLILFIAIMAVANLTSCTKSDENEEIIQPEFTVEEMEQMERFKEKFEKDWDNIGDEYVVTEITNIDPGVKLEDADKLWAIAKLQPTDSTRTFIDALIHPGFLQVGDVICERKHAVYLFIGLASREDAPGGYYEEIRDEIARAVIRKK